MKQPRFLRGIAVTAALMAGITFLSATSVQARDLAPQPPRLTAIHAGAPRLRVTPIKVNVVLIGYQPGAVDLTRLVGLLPHSGVSLLRDPIYYGPTPGVDQMQYRYATRVAGRAFDDAFFNHLAHSGSVGAPDFYQTSYNNQVHNSVDVGPHVRYIDAQDTESWLERNADRTMGINPNDYTVFLINWYCRPDFQFHVYTNRSNPDPDTGADPRVTLAQTHVRAWGGSSGPTWFLDLSAGPVYTDGSDNVDTADLTGAGYTDVRLPPIWDYGHVGYRAFDDLTGDLAATIRYAAIDDLFASSPIYNPERTLPLPGDGKQIALDIFEGDPTRSGLANVHPNLVRDAHRALEPYYPISVTVKDLPLSGDARSAYDTATFNNVTPGCWTQFGTPAAEFFCYFLGNYAQYFPTNTSNVVVPAVGFTTTDDASARVHFTGNTDDDYTTGTQTLIEELDTPQLQSSPAAIGYTHLTIHEAGHYMGLSHPHDGLDPEGEFDYGPLGPFFVAWAGDESASVMSYLPGNDSFDVFDNNNLGRDHYGMLSQAADYYAGLVLAQAPNARAYSYLALADGEFQAADLAVRAEQWVAAGADAVHGFSDIERAAAAVGIGPSAIIRADAATSIPQAGAPAAPSVQARVQPGDKRCMLEETCAVTVPGAGH